MARAYSNHFHSTGISVLAGTTTYDPQLKIPAGIGGARLKVKTARATVGTAGMTSGDELRMMRMKSSDRILRISWASDGGSTTYAADVGLYLAGSNGDGAVVDADLFASALALASGGALTEFFAESTVLTDEDRGLMLWQLADIGAATLTADPKVEYDIVLTSTATGTTAVEEVLLLVEYTDEG